MEVGSGQAMQGLACRPSKAFRLKSKYMGSHGQQEKTAVRTLSGFKQVPQPQSKYWGLLPALRNQHLGVHTSRLTLIPIQGPPSPRRSGCGLVRA